MEVIGSLALTEIGAINSLPEKPTILVVLPPISIPTLTMILYPLLKILMMELPDSDI